MELAFEKCQIAANGLGSDETLIVTFVNGVPARYVGNGSAVHVNHLIGLKFEEESVGLKAGMDNPTPGQVAYKFRAIITSDGRASVHGATSVWMVRVKRFFHGQCGFYSLLPSNDHEGR
jgi:hypothetical protein